MFLPVFQPVIFVEQINLIRMQVWKAGVLMFKRLANTWRKRMWEDEE
jgi:hypothetical protein